MEDEDAEAEEDEEEQQKQQLPQVQHQQQKQQHLPPKLAAPTGAYFLRPKAPGTVQARLSLFRPGPSSRAEPPLPLASPSAPQATPEPSSTLRRCALMSSMLQVADF